MNNTTTFKVYQTAFGDKKLLINPKVRLVTVPNDKLTGILNEDLEIIFLYGQNCFQPNTECYSTSSRDVIEYNNDLYLINDFGFIKAGDPCDNVCAILQIDFEYNTAHPFLEKHFGYLIPQKLKNNTTKIKNNG